MFTVNLIETLKINFCNVKHTPNTKLHFPQYFFFPHKRSFRGPGGVIMGVDSCCQAKICARELASVASRGSPVASRL